MFSCNCPKMKNGSTTMQQLKICCRYVDINRIIEIETLYHKNCKSSKSQQCNLFFEKWYFLPKSRFFAGSCKIFKNSLPTDYTQSCCCCGPYFRQKYFQFSMFKAPNKIEAFS